MDRAFSLERWDILDAFKAHELYEAGLISEKQGFECHDENCSAKITCVNIEKLFKNMKQFVHFRVIGNHSPKCRYTNIEIRKAELALEVNTESIENRYLDENTDMFILSRPANYWDKKSSIDISNPQARKEHKRILNKNLDISRRPINHYSIRALVSRFLNKSTLTDNNFVSINGKLVAYSDLFINIAKATFKEASDKNEDDKIYYQSAKIRLIKNNSFRIKFESHFIDTLIKPSFFINEKIIQDSKTQYWKNKLNMLVDTPNIELMVFIYGKPFEKNGYINFQCKNLDFMEILINS